MKYKAPLFLLAALLGAQFVNAQQPAMSATTGLGPRNSFTLFGCALLYFLGLRFACARSDAIGPRSRFGVFGLRKSFPARDASRFEVVIYSP
jgi:hypothetical protein